jgi:rhodanese-related sulfurtransferase
MADLNSKEWQQQLLNDSNALIIDVRTKDEVAEGMIPNAINIDVKDPQIFLDQINKLDKSKSFYMYCQSGARSAQACAVLNLMCDIPKAYSLVGGFNLWDGEVVR